MGMRTIAFHFPEGCRIRFRIADREADSLAVGREANGKDRATRGVERTRIFALRARQIKDRALGICQVLSVCRPATVTAAQFAQSLWISSSERQCPELALP